MNRIGHGYDFHRFSPNRRLVLGGVEIPYEYGLLGHSDADALVHAIIDALCGAVGLPDIGELYPDSNPRYKDADSLELLQDIKWRLDDMNIRISNIDCTIIADAPKFSPYKKEMARKIADALGIGYNQVNIKAKTEEGLGGEGIAVHAVGLVVV